MMARRRNYLYSAWRHMVQRCTNPKHQAWKWYGARGITVCRRWLDSFEDFCSDVGERPDKSYSLDRIDNQRGYSPDNCRWATVKEQAQNRRRPTERERCIRVDGLSLAALAKLHGIKRGTLKSRYLRGYRGEDLIADTLNGRFWRGKKRLGKGGKAILNGTTVLREAT